MIKDRSLARTDDHHLDDHSLLGGSGGIRTHASEETGDLNQRLRPLGHATPERWTSTLQVVRIFYPSGLRSLYSSVAERWSCKPKVMSSILIGGSDIFAAAKFKRGADKKH